MFAVLLAAIACAPAHSPGTVSVPPSPDWRTATPQLQLASWAPVVPVVPSDVHISTPTPTPTLPPPPAPPVAAAASSDPGPSQYVPVQWVEEWKACLDAPWRFDRTTWLATGPWDPAEAAAVADREGGWDACQFNTTGSRLEDGVWKRGDGGCGWLQDTPCEGLSPEAQIAASVRKWLSCGGSFRCAWSLTAR